MVQGIASKFICYGRSFDPCILRALNEISSEQVKPKINTARKCDMLMEYLHTNLDAVIRYHASEMVLKVVSVSYFLLLLQARSHAAAIYHLGWTDNNKLSDLVDTLYQTIKNVADYAFEAKTVGIYLGSRHGFPMCITCIELGQPKSKTGTPF